MQRRIMAAVVVHRAFKPMLKFTTLSGEERMPEENALTIRTQVRDNIGYVYLQGQLVASSRFDLERLLRGWHETGVNCVVVSCRDLRYIDSAGMSTMIGAMHRLRRVSGDLLLTDISGSLHALFEVSQLEHYFRIFTSVEEALAHFREEFARKRSKGRRAASPNSKKSTARKKTAGKTKTAKPKKTKKKAAKKAVKTARKKKTTAKKKSPRKAKSARKKTAGRKKAAARKK